ncbi:MAG: DegT/DnrJ/EryC1/StrS family aminotransferase [Ilumatobacteraceae bacterium]
MTTTRYFSLARHALVEALRAIDIKPGDAVAVPSLVCRELLASLATVGARPVYYHVDESLKPVSFPNDHGIRAVIAVNYFGFAQDLSPFVQYSSSIDAVLIEDNAHGFLSADGSGNLLGTRGALGVTSIRKTIRMADGAMLTANEPPFVDRIHAQLPSTTHLDPAFRLRRAVATIERRLHIPILRMMRTISRRIRRAKTGSTLPISSATSETDILALSGPRKSSLSILKRLDSNSEIRRRHGLYWAVHQALAGLSVTPLYPQLPHGTVPYGYPFYGDESTMQDAQRRVAKFGVEIIRWPDLPEAIAHTAPYHYTNLWLVNFL